ncbi:RidA family protein [Rhizobium sp. BR 314]|uniref:RidA family protein n=1 Tax=Rhizobium sp. BR 314 TaxID=3040013 RepID=UPI0039BF1508
MVETPEHRLQAMGLRLPSILKPAGNLLGFKIDQGLVFVSGQLPLENGQSRHVGKVGASVATEEGNKAAALAALNVVAQLKLATGGHLSRVREIVKLSGFVNCAPDFVDIGAVVDGASDLLVSVFGEQGRHARFAIGVQSLPRGVPVEVEVIARLSNEE